MLYVKKRKMIKHVVCFKLIDNSYEKKIKAKEVLLSMIGNVYMALDIKVGIDFLESARSFDVILEVILASKEKLDEYQNDPYHCNVVKKYMHSVVEKSISIDMEIE